METENSPSIARQPWNKGKPVGQKNGQRRVREATVYGYIEIDGR